MLAVLLFLYSQKKILYSQKNINNLDLHITKKEEKKKCNKLLSLFIYGECVPIIELDVFICIFLYLAVAHVGAEHPESV